MGLISLEAENFKQYPKLGPIEFVKEGVIGILGPNGAGKTTILTAIDIALFGKSNGTLVSEIKYDKAKKGQKWWIKLEFEVSGIVYTVVRHENTAKSYLLANGTMITEGQTNVTEHIANKILRMDQLDFTNAFYTKQFELDKLMKETDETRKRQIAKLLRIDEIDKAIQLARKDKNKLDTLIEEQKNYVVPETYFEEQENTLKIKKEEATKNVEKYKKVLTEQEETHQEHTKKLERLEALYQQYQELNSNIQNAANEKKYIEQQLLPQTQNKLIKIKEETKSIPSLQEETKELPMTEERIQLLDSQKIIFERKKFLTTEKNRLTTLLASKKQIIDRLKSDLTNKNYEKLISELESKTNELSLENAKEQSVVTELNSKLYLISEDGRRKRQEINEIKKLGTDSTCPVCKRGLGEHHHHLVNTLQEQINTLLKEHRATKSELDAKLQTVNKLQEQINTIGQELERLKEERNLEMQKKDALQRERQYFSESKADYTRVDEELKNLNEVNFDENEYQQLLKKRNYLLKQQNSLGILLSKRDELPTLEKELNNYTSRLRILNDTLSTLEKQIQGLNFNAQEYEETKRKTSILFENLRTSERHLLQNQQILDSIANETKELKAKKIENKEIVKTLEKRKKEFSTLLYLDEVFKNLKINELKESSPRIEQTMQHLVTYLTDGKYDSIQLDENYKVFINRNGKYQPVNQFSGGEQMLFSLILRLAITQEIIAKNGNKNIGFLTLDEILGAQDKNRRKNILDALNKLTSVFNQIFLISHDEDINDTFEHVLEVKQNADGSSSVSWKEEY